MRLTQEKLLAAWKMRKQIFNEPANEHIIKRFEMVQDLFNTIISFQYHYDTERKVFCLNGKDVVFLDGSLPSTNYFSAKADDMTEYGAYNGVVKMRNRFPTEYEDVILKIGSLLGGFTFDDLHVMVDEYRIISNTITTGNDNGSLSSIGQTRHPSSNFADNNYFFNVIGTIHEIKEDIFKPENSKLVLRWPAEAYYSDDSQAEVSQKAALRNRFPYKFFYMWTHDVLHPVSLMAYRNLIQQQDAQIKYEPDEWLNQDYNSFIADKGWPLYSNKICDMIPEPERGDNFLEELSKLVSVIMIQDQQMKDIQELLETGNKAIILFGPPGTGKTYQAMELVCKELNVSKEDVDKYKYSESSSVLDKGAWTLVQFHPNYTYEDFIGGITPNIEGNTLSYFLKEGVFKKLCDTAVKSENENKKFIIVIDEINRADLSSVFGELMYALEYRDKIVSIPNFKEPFVIPSNIYIIGTMNSIDKSLVTFDLALRRRFGFIKIMPDVSVLETILAEYNIEESCLTTYIERCKSLNDRIANPSSRLNLGADYQIGHAYYGKIKDFLKKRDATDTPQSISSFDLEKLWEYHLQPLLEEYLGNRVDDNEVWSCMNSIKDDFTKPLT